MKFRQFKITEAPDDNAAFKAELRKFYSTLTKKDPKDGFFANNARKNENMRLVAQFAQDNDLQSMLNPLTGKSYKFADATDAEGPGETGPEEVNMDMAALERLAGVGGLTPGVMEKLKSEAADATSGEAGLGGRTLSSLFGIKDPEHAAAVQNILAKQDAATKVPSADAGTQAQQVSAAPKKLSGPEMLSRLADIPAVSDALGARGDMDADTEFSDPNVMTKKAPTPAAKSKAPYSMGTPGGEYKIKSGDTLSAIAKKAGTTVDAIMKANPNIKDANRIAAGGALNMPGASKPAGDTTGDGPSPAELKPDARDTTGDGPAPSELKPTITGKTPTSSGALDTGNVQRATPDQEKAVAAKFAYRNPDVVAAAQKIKNVDPDFSMVGGATTSQAKPAPNAAKAPTAAPKVVPATATSVPKPGEVAPRVSPRPADNVSLPRTQRKQPDKTPPKKTPLAMTTVMSGHDGTTRLKYLAGIKE